MSRTSTVRFMLEGSEAEAATRDLFSMGWFEAEWEQRRDKPPSAALSAVSARVIAIAAGSVTIADKLLGWWDKWRNAGAEGGVRLSIVLEVPSGPRVALGTASRDELVEVLRTLHAPAGR